MTSLQNQKLKECLQACEAFALKYGKRPPRKTVEGRWLYNSLRTKLDQSEPEAVEAAQIMERLRTIAALPVCHAKTLQKIKTAKTEILAGGFGTGANRRFIKNQRY